MVAFREVRTYDASTCCCSIRIYRIESDKMGPLDFVACMCVVLVVAIEIFNIVRHHFKKISATFQNSLRIELILFFYLSFLECFLRFLTIFALIHYFANLHNIAVSMCVCVCFSRIVCVCVCASRLCEVGLIVLSVLCVCMHEFVSVCISTIVC